MRSTQTVVFFAIWALLGASNLAHAQPDSPDLVSTYCKTGDDTLINAILDRLEYADKNLPLLKKEEKKKIMSDSAAVAFEMLSSNRDTAKLEKQLEGQARYRLWILRNGIEGMLHRLKLVLNPQALDYSGKPKPITFDNPEAEKLWRALEVSMQMPWFLSSLEIFLDGEQGREFSKLLAKQSAQIKTDARTSSHELVFFMACKLAKVMSNNKPIAVVPPKVTKIVCKTFWDSTGKQEPNDSYVIDFEKATVNGYAARINEQNIIFQAGKMTVIIDRVASNRRRFFDGASSHLTGDCSRVENAAF